MQPDIDTLFGLYKIIQRERAVRAEVMVSLLCKELKLSRAVAYKYMDYVSRPFPSFMSSHKYLPPILLKKESYYHFNSKGSGEVIFFIGTWEEIKEKEEFKKAIIGGLENESSVNV